MRHSLVRSMCAAAALALLAAPALHAQATIPTTPRIILTPHAGLVVGHSQGAAEAAFATVTAEMPLGGGWSATAEGMGNLSKYAIRVCAVQANEGCRMPTDMRWAGSVGVTARPFTLGPISPYAGVSGGAARWEQNGVFGTGPMAVARAGVDVRVAGPVGVRADVARRYVWVDGADDFRADVFSLGASFSVGR